MNSVWGFFFCLKELLNQFQRNTSGNADIFIIQVQMWFFLKGRVLILLMVFGYFLPSFQRNIYVSFHSKVFCPLISVENRDSGSFKHYQVKSVGDYNMVSVQLVSVYPAFILFKSLRVKSTLQIQEVHKIAAKTKKKAFFKKKKPPVFIVHKSHLCVDMGAFGVQCVASPRHFMHYRSSDSSCEIFPFLLQQKSQQKSWGLGFFRGKKKGGIDVQSCSQLLITFGGWM